MADSESILSEAEWERAMFAAKVNERTDAATALRRHEAALRERVAVLTEDLDLAHGRELELESLYHGAQARVAILEAGLRRTVDALLPTLDSVHPLEYGFRDGHAVTGYAADDATVVDRMARCFSCEEWSPCSVRESVDSARALLGGSTRHERGADVSLSSEIAATARQMRANSERWFPWLHDGSDVDLKVFYALGLAGEAGEVANVVKKGMRTCDGPNYDDLGAELADVFTYLLLLADECGVDLEAEYRDKVLVNEARWGVPAAAPPQKCPSCGYALSLSGAADRCLDPFHDSVPAAAPEPTAVYEPYGPMTPGREATLERLIAAVACPACGSTDRAVRAVYDDASRCGDAWHRGVPAAAPERCPTCDSDSRLLTGRACQQRVDAGGRYDPWHDLGSLGKYDASLVVGGAAESGIHPHAFAEGAAFDVCWCGQRPDAEAHRAWHSVPAAAPEDDT